MERDQINSIRIEAPGAMISKQSMPQQHLEKLLKCRFLNPAPHQFLYVWDTFHYSHQTAGHKQPKKGRFTLVRYFRRFYPLWQRKCWQRQLLAFVLVDGKQRLGDLRISLEKKYSPKYIDSISTYFPHLGPLHIFWFLNMLPHYKAIKIYLLIRSTPSGSN